MFTIETSFASTCPQWFHSDYDMIRQQIQLLPIEQRKIDKIGRIKSVTDLCNYILEPSSGQHQ